MTSETTGVPTVPSIDVSRISIPVASLAKIEPAERAALLLLGHALNEINVLRKAAMASSNRLNDVGTEREEIEMTTSTILMRIWMGKIFEAWEMFRTRIQSQRWAQTYLSRLSKESTAAKDTLNRLFGKSGELARVRNEYAFHTPPNEAIDQAFKSIEERDDCRFYFSASDGNSCYLFSETIVTLAMAFADDSDGIRSRWETLISCYTEASDNMRVLFGEAFALMLSNRSGLKRQIAFVVSDPVSVDRMDLPFFIAGSAHTAEDYYE